VHKQNVSWKFLILIYLNYITHLYICPFCYFHFHLFIIEDLCYSIIQLLILLVSLNILYYFNLFIIESLLRRVP
jgi:hypothetical protein